MIEYVIAKYIRLSLDEAVTESMSIPHQRLMLDKHIDGLEIPNATVLEFVDNGHSGTNMERPAVQEMLELARSGRIHCIVTKDFSRFSRNSMDSEYFIAQVFPLYRIRFISVGDNFDSDEYKNDTGGIDVAFKFLMHEYYSADLSKKVRSAKRAQMARGENIVANAIYGYRKNGLGKWEPDPEAADVVRLMYRMALGGHTPASIRDTLFEMGCPTPREYAELKRGKDILPTCHWEARAVTRTLTNEQYIGAYISGKQEAKAIGSHSKDWVDKSEWIVIPDSHPPLVGKEDFAKVQGLMAGYMKSRTERLQTGNPTSGNARSAKWTRMEGGGSVAAFPIYGYAKLENGQWEPEPRTSGVVRQIFKMALEGLGAAQIATKLTEAGHPTPREQLYIDRGKSMATGKAWRTKGIRDILRNVQYTGAYVSGKTPAKLDGTGAYYHARKNEWIVIPGRHPAIIGEADFNAVQALLEQRESGKREMKQHDYLLKGKTRCGCCGRALSYDAVSSPVYRCYHTAADPNADCHKMKVSVRELDDAVIAVVRKQAEVVLKSSSLSELKVKDAGMQTAAGFERQINECVEQRQRYYEQFVMREIDRETHQSLKADCAARIERLKNQLAALVQYERDKKSAQKSAALAKQAISESASAKEIVDALIERVLVFPGDRIEIQWKVADFAVLQETGV